ncbi:CatA-like O-acetyltransferase [Roseateles asaccharophilus]|uniref:Chloramphenicol O-acetyltransferase type A n=1 Tax=Roseateles asaccharophilus TaxID=582607 RepID=A0ABU2A5X5_9BURK|nr:CatA-like O-acetyltransferase [Roseateles asaccharophilus]MDR7332551.1 chloramphenicol O-acetyltransferase type A [Roseateles asaccharophilus]
MPDRDIPLASWPRRAALEHFRRMAQPAFSVTVPVDVTGLRERAAAHGATPWLAYHHAALEAANTVDGMRQTLKADGTGVREFELIHASTTVLRDDGSFGFLTLPRDPSLAAFAERAKSHLPRIRSASGDLFAADAPGDVREETLVHMTALPWFAFTAFTHARGQGDDRPKIAFGRFTEQGGRLLMPVAVDVHHALCDGAHVGRFFEQFQSSLDEI